MIYAMIGAGTITAALLRCTGTPRTMIGLLVAGTMMIIIGAANSKARA